MIAKLIRWFGQPALLGCDARCEKAWGINTRPKRMLGEDEDDYVFLADDELGEAPTNPGTYEGPDGKPGPDDERLNKWCARECERSELTTKLGELVSLGLYTPEPNMGFRRGQQNRQGEDDASG